ncbi:Ferric cupric reductase transmembrane component 7 [Lecanosticta acicola]|uniref:Ferric cupric reductase transmembrane component 7 n=1 Tax=Lecanosticta acicola TaxID=111012 RepID=A0AAI8YRF3_9PEZI|nr:Ferric cupric reductase transmembrane component 7 [Lecanosticta acicola]
MDMSGMDMGGASSAPLSPDGVDFSNTTQAAEFLDQLLDDDELKVIGNNYAKYFWYGVVAAVGVAAVFNLLRWWVLQMRLREAARKVESPAKPKGLAARWFATITAMGREMSYAQWSPATRFPFFRIPPVGTIALLLAYLAFVLALEFVDNHVAGAQYWQALGVRAGWLAVAQVPLLVLLINKNNIIGLLTGVSYERLNVIHRWSARIMLLLAIFHFAFQSTGWQKYGVMRLEWETDDCPPTGIAAFALLLWMNLTTIAPIRSFSYEFFVVQHVLTFFGFIIAIVLHLPSTALTSRVYIYIPIGLYLADRIIRTVFLAWHNLRVSRATLTQLEGDVTKARISNKAIKSWRPGAHVLISIPRFGFLQSHPATILSTPRSHAGDLVFILKSHQGFTKRIMEGASSSTTALVSEKNDEVEKNTQVSTHLAFLDGPYGAGHSDFAAFDSVCLIAGSTGVTFTTSILEDIADRSVRSDRTLPVRRIHFVWCVKDTNWTSWIGEELATISKQMEHSGIQLQISIYVTCAEKFTNPGSAMLKECGCQCEQVEGQPCCCVRVDADDDDDDDDEEEIQPTSAGKQPLSTTAVSVPSSLNSDIMAGRRLPILPCAIFYSGRPRIREVVSSLLDNAEGESAVGVCGPLGLTSEVRNVVVGLSDERAIHKGTGAQGCYLHVEGPN